jgi:replication factor A1
MTILKMNVNLEDVIDKIISATKKSKKDILKQIEMKKEDLGGLITDEGAACIVAKELGVEIFEPISYKRKRAQIKDLTVGMNAVSIIGRIIAILPVREFTTKKGQKGTVAKFVLQDPSDQIQVVLWNDQTHLISQDKIKENDLIEIKNAYVKAGIGTQLELHLNRQGVITPNPNEVDPSEFNKLPPKSSPLKINELKEGMRNIDIIGRVQWKSPISTFQKQNSSSQVASLRIADETGVIRVALWGNHAPFVDQVDTNDAVHILNGYTRQTQDGSTELHVSDGSKIQKETSTTMEVSAAPPTPPAARNLAEVKISDLTTQRKNIKVTGKIIKKDTPREVTFKADNSAHQVCDVVIADETGSISLSIWDDDISKIQENKTYCIENGYVSTFRDTLKLNVGKFVKIIENPTEIDNSNTENNLSEKKMIPQRKNLSEIAEYETIQVLGNIVAIPDQNPIYESCPTCSKKVTSNEGSWECINCGKIKAPIPRMLWSFTLDDGTSHIRVTVMDKVAEKLINMTIAEAQKMIEETLSEQYPLISKSKELLGKIILVSGSVRLNSYKSGFKLMASDVSFPDPREELSNLLTRVENLFTQP